MIKIAVVSDTHGSALFIQKSIQKINPLRVDEVWHLGDHFSDAQAYIDAGFVVTRVPGTWTSQYEDPKIDNRRFEERAGWRFLLTHTPTRNNIDLPEDVDPAHVILDQRVDVVIHGHTHHPGVQLNNAVYMLNPGHLKQGDDRGFPPTFGEMIFTPQGLDFRIHMLLEDQLWESHLLSRRLDKLPNLS